MINFVKEEDKDLIGDIEKSSSEVIEELPIELSTIQMK